MTLQFFEYDYVAFKYHGFTEAQIKAFRHFHTITDGCYYDLRDGGIRFKEQVGVIQVGNLTIEVLPKIDRGDNEKKKWRDTLLQMLKECRFLLPESAGYAHLKLQSNAILDLYFEIYIRELEILLHQGLIKKYRTTEGNQSALTGRLLFSQHIQQNLTHAERFYTEHSVYDECHALHQVLRQALEIVCRLTDRTLLSDSARLLSLQWPSSQPLAVNEQLFTRFPITRKTEPYREALQIAKLILLNYHPDLSGGKENVLALMFNMNDLWEKFIFHRIREAGRQLEWKVSEQRELRYWKGDTGGKKLIPDIIIEKPDGCKIVIDTKWKRPADRKPEDHDLRQLLAYKLYFQGSSAFLLYPCNDSQSFVVNGNYHPHAHQTQIPVFRDGFSHNGGLMFLNIMEEKKLITRASFSLMIRPLLD